MEKDMMKVINQLFQDVKLVVDMLKNDLDTTRKNVDKYKIIMENLEYEYQIYERKKILIQFKHYVLMILTLGIYTKLFKKHYEDKIDDIEENISEIIGRVCDLQANSNFNEFILEISEKSLSVAMQQYEKLEFLLSLSDEERQKYLNYKMGDSNASNKNS